MQLRNIFGDLLLDPEDYDYFTFLGIRPSSNARSGVYYCLKRKKVYVHREVLRQSGLDIRPIRVGFLDGIPQNCMKRNLFHYEITENPVAAKRAAWEAAAKRAKQGGYVIGKP